MRIVRILLTLWLTIVVFSIADEYQLSREAIGKYLIVLGLGFVSTVVHELGHAMAAWKVGFQVKRIAALPFQFDVTKRKFGLAKSRPSQDIAGYVVAVIPEWSNAKQRAVFALGGPAAEAIMGTLLLAGMSGMSLIQLPLDSCIIAQVPPDSQLSYGSNSGQSNVSRLPSDSVIAEQMEPAIQQIECAKRAHMWEGLLKMLAILSLSSAVLNLIPIGGSDGAMLRIEIREILCTRKF